MALDTPFQCGGAVKTFPEVPKNQSLYIRVEVLTDAQVNIKFDNNPTQTKADIFLLSGEAYKLDGPETNIRILNVGAVDPNIYWYIR
jgi:hypothetical protein